MGSFLGGSAPAMARQVCEGFSLMSPVMLKRLSLDQLRMLEFEVDKSLRQTRAEVMDLEDQAGLTQRNRRISRIESALRVLRHSMQQKKMGRL